jgi:Undecaprenyl-phosphate glucose phosphotransferase
MSSLAAPPCTGIDSAGAVQQPSGDKPSTRKNAVGMIRGSFGFINRLVTLIDSIAVLIASAMIQNIITRLDGPLTLSQGVIVGIAAASAHVATLRLAGAYRVERYAHLRKSIYDLVRGSLVAAVITMIVLWSFAPGAEADLRQLLVAILGLFGCLVLGRGIARILYHRLQESGFLRRSIAIVGAGPLGREIAANIRSEERNGDYELVGLFTDAGEEVLPDNAGHEEVTGSIEKLRHIAHSRQIDMIVLALPWSRADHIFEFAGQIQWISADVLVPVETSGFLPQALKKLGGKDMLILVSHPFKGTEGLVKVVEDYVVAALGMVVALPIMFVAAIAIRYTSEGPILFRQPRLGFNGGTFHIYKFRTMTVDLTDDGSVAVERGSPRITKVGAFLRRSSIDELPQLFNVFRGEMSIVGPRPHVPKMLIEGDIYSDTVRTYAARHRFKPGITGWAQINGMRGGIDTVEKARRNVELDLYYTRNWSVRFDLYIMLQTVTRHLAGREIF